MDPEVPMTTLIEATKNCLEIAKRSRKDEGPFYVVCVETGQYIYMYTGRLDEKA